MYYQQEFKNILVYSLYWPSNVRENIRLGRLVQYISPSFRGVIVYPIETIPLPSGIHKADAGLMSFGILGRTSKVSVFMSHTTKTGVILPTNCSPQSWFHSYSLPYIYSIITKK